MSGDERSLALALALIIIIVQQRVRGTSLANLRIHVLSLIS